MGFKSIIMVKKRLDEFESFTLKLRGGRDLSGEEAELAALALASAEVDPNNKKAFLTALVEKGESVAEVTAFASTFRDLARDPGLEDFAERAIDVVGTGGDKSGSFNISTTAAFIVAAAGVPVFKHGNRSITSKCGSADLLAALGFDIEAGPDKLRHSLENLNFCFFFAPAWHPAFKEIIPVRKELAAEGKRTIFNILGPLINPGRPACQLMGVFGENWVEPLAASLEALGLKRGLVVHGRMSGNQGMDELTCAGENRVAGFGDLKEVDGLWVPEDFGLNRCSARDLAGGGIDQNLELLDDILEGRGRRGLVDTILLNAGAALWAANQTADIGEGVSRARDLLLGGAVKDWLRKACEFYSS